LFAASGTFFASLEKELKDYEQRKGDYPFSTQQARSGTTHQPDSKTARRELEECRPAVTSLSNGAYPIWFPLELDDVIPYYRREG